MSDPPVAFRVHDHELPALQVRVNFGVFAGRHATPAEIDGLAGLLHEWARTFSIVSEERHEFAGSVEAQLHQVVIELPRGQAVADPEALARRVVEAAEAWARECIASRHGGGEL